MHLSHLPKIRRFGSDFSSIISCWLAAENTSTGTRDAAFINLVVLVKEKSFCLSFFDEHLMHPRNILIDYNESHFVGDDYISIDDTNRVEQIGSFIKIMCDKNRFSALICLKKQRYR